MMSAEYDKDAARAAILYIAQFIAEPTFHKVSKVFYFADRHHLEHYGSLMFGDTYKALNYGPVPSETHKVMTSVESGETDSAQEGYYVCRRRITDGSIAPVIYAVQEPDLDELSQSMVESLDISILHCKDKSFKELCDLSHDQAWTSIRRETGQWAPVMTVELIASTLPNAATLLDYLSDPYPGESTVSMHQS